MNPLYKPLFWAMPNVGPALDLVEGGDLPDSFLLHSIPRLLVQATHGHSKATREKVRNI